MKIVIINGSNKKDGATATILKQMHKKLLERKDVEVKFIHVADMDLKYCIGCGICYKKGGCIYSDDIEELSVDIKESDGIILGSPTYASNVSAQMKTIIDRGHFVMEQLLSGKHAISVVTYENYGGHDAGKIINKLLLYSGAIISGSIVTRQYQSERTNRKIHMVVNKFYKDMSAKGKGHIFQMIKHLFIFWIGIYPFVKKNPDRYSGVLKNWKI